MKRALEIRAVLGNEPVVFATGVDCEGILSLILQESFPFRRKAILSTGLNKSPTFCDVLAYVVFILCLQPS